MLFEQPLVILLPLQPRNGTTGSHGGPGFNFNFSSIFRFYFRVRMGEGMYVSPCIVKVKDHFWGSGFSLPRTSIVFPIMTVNLHFQHEYVRALFPAHPQQHHSLTTARIASLIFSGWLRFLLSLVTLSILSCNYWPRHEITEHQEDTHTKKKQASYCFLVCLFGVYSGPHVTLAGLELSTWPKSLTC